MVAVLLVDVGLAIYILPKDPAMDLFIYSDGVQVDFTIGEKFYFFFTHILHSLNILSLRTQFCVTKCSAFISLFLLIVMLHNGLRIKTKIFIYLISADTVKVSHVAGERR